jgi:hypothetical protein
MMSFLSTQCRIKILTDRIITFSDDFRLHYK